MNRKGQSLDGTYENPNVSLSAEEIEEVDHDNEAVAAEENVRAAPGYRFSTVSQLFPLIAAYWMILLVVIPLHIHFTLSHKSDTQDLKLLNINHTFLLEENYNLKNLNNKLSSDLKVQVHNLTQQKGDLTAALNQVEKENQELQKNFTEQIETMERTWNEQKLSQAQQIIDEYCPKDNNNVRWCSSCQRNLIHSQSSCYAVNNPQSRGDQKTWEEAREDCRGKISDLTVVGDETEKTFVDGTSWTGTGINGYWIGLKAVEGKWKWIDGSDLTNQAWIQRKPATDGQCVTSLQNRGWRSMNCNERNAWLCEKKALSV